MKKILMILLFADMLSSNCSSQFFRQEGSANQRKLGTSGMKENNENVNVKINKTDYASFNSSLFFALCWEQIHKLSDGVQYIEMYHIM